MSVPTLEQIESVEKKCRVDESIVRAALVRIPPGWHCLEHSPSGGAFRRGSVQVLFSVMRYEDGRIWLHVSACGRTPSGGFRLPAWEELKRIKLDFIGGDAWAYQVFPSAAQYVNQNPAVLHLFALLDGKPALPDFTWGLGTL